MPVGWRSPTDHIQGPKQGEALSRQLCLLACLHVPTFFLPSQPRNTDFKRCLKVFEAYKEHSESFGRTSSFVNMGTRISLGMLQREGELGQATSGVSSKTNRNQFGRWSIFIRLWGLNLLFHKTPQQQATISQASFKNLVLSVF